MGPQCSIHCDDNCCVPNRRYGRIKENDNNTTLYYKIKVLERRIAKLEEDKTKEDEAWK